MIARRLAPSLLVAAALATTLLGGRAAADEGEAGVGVRTRPASDLGRAEPLLSLADCGTAAASASRRSGSS